MTHTELSELDRMLAEKVMRWHEERVPAGPDAGELWFCTTPHLWAYRVSLWQPTRSIEQAMMLATKIGSYLTLTQGSVAWDARIESTKGSGSAFAVEPALAICLAAKAWLASQPTATSE